jgi:hypothetical protein
VRCRSAWKSCRKRMTRSTAEASTASSSCSTPTCGCRHCWRTRRSDRGQGADGRHRRGCARERGLPLHALAIAAAELDHDDGERREWLTLSKMESELAREQAKLSKFSDPKTPRSLELRKKLESVRTALKAMMESRLAPKERRS